MESFDFVIVGGGTAAGILAWRLGEAGHSVCVLEAGPPDDRLMMRVPAGFMKTLFDPNVTFQLASEPTENTGGRAIPYTQGKTLGGSSTVNGMVYNRGQAADFDGWAQRGALGWNYVDVLPYFRRTERHLGGGDPTYRGDTGRLVTSRSRWPCGAVDAFIASAQVQGHPFNTDYNGASQAGVGYYQSAIHKGRRVSTATAFLHPARKAFGVEVRTHAQATRLILDGRRATGVAYLQGGMQRTVSARVEVIVSAGVTNSPKLLQLSGVGPGALLRGCGVEVRHELAGVGENFRDHYSPRLVMRARDGVDTLNAHVSGLPLAAEVAKWLVGRPSVLALSPALVHVFGKSDPVLDNPDYSLVFTPGSYRQGFIGRLDDFPGMTCGAWQMRPESRGYVRIRSADPNEPPLINPNYLADETDRRVLVKALKAARAIFRTEPLAGLVERELFPGDEVSSDADWLDFARRHGNSSYHLVGSCRMGAAGDPEAVVDPRLRVRGMTALRVVDASVMPTMPSANTYASTMMVAEKGAVMIIEDARAALAA